MAIKGFYESSLATSEIYSGINNTDGQEVITKKAINLIKTSRKLTNEDIEAAYISVKQISDTLTREAIKAFDEERVVLLYTDTPSLRMSQALPFITFKNAKLGSYTTYVFADKYISTNRDGVMSMQAPILRDLLTGALIANGLKRNYDVLASNQYLQRVMMEVYTKLVVRIINREYSVIADKITFDTIQYWINRFFLSQLLNSNDTPENIEITAKKHFKFIDEIKYEEIKNLYESSNPQKFSDLLELLKNASPRMRTLNLPKFLSSWINYYYVPSMLAIDNIEYLIFMMIALLNSSGILSITASDIVKEAKNIKSFKGELLKLI